MRGSEVKWEKEERVGIGGKSTKKVEGRREIKYKIRNGREKIADSSNQRKEKDRIDKVTN